MINAIHASEYPELSVPALDHKVLPVAENGEPFLPFYKWCQEHSTFERLASDIRQRVSDEGYCLVKGLPVDEVCGGKPIKNTAISELVLLCATQSIGMPYGYKGQRGGRVVHDITPQPDANEEHQSGSNKNYLEWHTEDAGLKYNCDFIALYCLRNDPKTTTILCVLRDLGLSDEALMQLQKPEFSITADRQYQSYSQNPQALLVVDDDVRSFRIDPLFTECANDNARLALDELIEKANASKLDIILEPGDLLIFNNRACMHGRSKINYQSAEDLRWLQRVMLFDSEIPDQRLDRDSMNIVLEKLIK